MKTRQNLTLTLSIFFTLSMGTQHSFALNETGLALRDSHSSAANANRTEALAPAKNYVDTEKLNAFEELLKDQAFQFQLMGHILSSAEYGNEDIQFKADKSIQKRHKMSEKEIASIVHYTLDFKKSEFERLRDAFADISEELLTTELVADYKKLDEKRDAMFMEEFNKIDSLPDGMEKALRSFSLFDVLLRDDIGVERFNGKRNVHPEVSEMADKLLLQSLKPLPQKIKMVALVVGAEERRNYKELQKIVDRDEFKAHAGTAVTNLLNYRPQSLSDLSSVAFFPHFMYKNLELTYQLMRLEKEPRPKE